MVLHLVVLALLVAAVAWSVIELGLSAYLVSLFARFDDLHFFFNASVYDYLVFSSVWSLLVSAFLLIWPFANQSQSPLQKESAEKWLSPLTLALNFVTMVFWLAAFASLANEYDDYTVKHVPGAQEAFAVLLWLLFLALFILNVLSAFGVFDVNRAGYSSIFNKTKADEATNGGNEIPEVP